MSDFDFYRSGALLALHTFAAHLLTALSLPLLFLPAAARTPPSPPISDSTSRGALADLLPADLLPAALPPPCAMPPRPPAPGIGAADPGHKPVTCSSAGCTGCAAHATQAHAASLLDSSPHASAAPLCAAAHASAQAALAFGLLRALTAGTAMLSAAIQRRHLMVWALFAPKFVFEAAFLLVSDAALAAAALACWLFA